MLEVKNLTKIYDGEVLALDQVSFQNEEGQFMAAIGLSGSGKSTLLRCINRLVEPTEGQVIWEGIDITAAPQEDLRHLRRRFGMIFQRINKGVFPMFGDGKTTYHPVYVDNVGDAHMILMEEGKGDGEAYLIADEEFFEIEEGDREVPKRGLVRLLPGLGTGWLSPGGTRFFHRSRGAEGEPFPPTGQLPALLPQVHRATPEGHRARTVPSVCAGESTGMEHHPGTSVRKPHPEQPAACRAGTGH